MWLVPCTKSPKYTIFVLVVYPLRVRISNRKKHGKSFRILQVNPGGAREISLHQFLEDDVGDVATEWLSGCERHWVWSWWVSSCEELVGSQGSKGVVCGKTWTACRSNCFFCKPPFVHITFQEVQTKLGISWRFCHLLWLPKDINKLHEKRILLFC